MSYVQTATLPYHGVLIERPCSVCDTTDLHFDGRCMQGPCTVCGELRGTHYQGAAGVEPHEWTGASYQPALIADAPASFDAIISMARLMGMPAHFRSDLYRDYQALTNQGLWSRSQPLQRFIWTVRSTGTDLITERTRAQTAELLIVRNERHFLWQDNVLTEVSAAQALAAHSLWDRQAVPA